MLCSVNLLFCYSYIHLIKVSKHLEEVTSWWSHLGISNLWWLRVQPSSTTGCLLSRVRAHRHMYYWLYFLPSSLGTVKILVTILLYLILKVPVSYDNTFPVQPGASCGSSTSPWWCSRCFLFCFAGAHEHWIFLCFFFHWTGMFPFFNQITL